MAARKTYRRRKYYRRRYYKRKKALFATNNSIKERFILNCRVRVLNDLQGVGQGYHWFQFGQNVVIQHQFLNLWTDFLQGNADFAQFRNQYSQFKIYAVSINAIPSNVQLNSINNRQDCTAFIYCQPVRAANQSNQRQLMLNPLGTAKMYFKVSPWTFWCYTNPTAEQNLADNGTLVQLVLGGNSFVNPQENCPQWTIRLTVYCYFKGKQNN